jgi:DNA-binding transcriptional ArsR family regulator
LAVLTSYDTATLGDNTRIVNQVKWEYDGWGDVARVWQSHDGRVGANTPSVQYDYETGVANGVAKYARLHAVTYADGRVVEYGYGQSGGVNDVLSRIEKIGATGQSDYAQYTYLGDGTIVSVAHPGVSGGLTLNYGTATDPNGGYAGLDRFGRVLEQAWTEGSGENVTPVDVYGYEYDAAGNLCKRLSLCQPTVSHHLALLRMHDLVANVRVGKNIIYSVAK